MLSIKRPFDIQPLMPDLTVHINGQSVSAAFGETVLSVIQSVGIRQIARNDHDQMSGAYCGMGVCHCCLVKINGQHKKRACQTVVHDGMSVQTLTNRLVEQQGI